MKKFSLLYIAAALCMATACNDDDDTQEASAESLDYPSSTEVTSFSLRSTKYVDMADSVFFTIDLVNAVIYNADSLPVGTDVRRIPVQVGVKASSAIEFIMPSLQTQADTVVDYLTNPTDSLNFVNGFTRLRILSQDGSNERIYTVKLNVHRTNPDSLQWNRVDNRRLPTTIGSSLKQKTVMAGEKWVNITRGEQRMTCSVTTTPMSEDWDITDITLPADADINTLTGTDSGELYLLDAAGSLWCSTDLGQSWTATGSTGWTWLYGSLSDEVVGAKGTQGWAKYPEDVVRPYPAGLFPVSGTSQMVSYQLPWQAAPQAMLTGGRTADGSLTGMSWGFDGQSWLELSVQGYRLPDAEGYTLFPYFTYRTSSSTVTVTTHSAWVAMGGLMADGTMNPTVYTSMDSGLHWKKAATGLQLPKELAPRQGAQALLCDVTLTPTSRAVKPITEWDCPYILLFGGYTATGALYNQTWYGVLNRLSFQPLQ